MDYLVKPFPRERLTDAVKRALPFHESRRADAEIPRELDEVVVHALAR